MDCLKNVLTEETYNTVSAELEGKDIKLVDLNTGDYVSKNKYNDELSKANSGYTELEAKYNTATSELEALKSKLADTEKQTADIETLKQTHETELADLQKKFDAELLKQRAYRVIDKANANDSDIVMSLIDLGKVTVDEDNKLQGLTEQLDALKESKAFLFGTKTTKASAMALNGTQTTNDKDDKLRKAFGLPTPNK